MALSRHYSFWDCVCIGADNLLHATFQKQALPAFCSVEQMPLSSRDQRISGQLLRINHAGEVCAQALYLGQALAAEDPVLRADFLSAAVEERAHLSWCATRLGQLKAHRSLLNPLWAMGSLILGHVFGRMGRTESLGFMAETERQVMAHLEDHLSQLPSSDKVTRTILVQMQRDEQKHADWACQAGATPLNPLIQRSMRAMAGFFRTLSRYF